MDGDSISQIYESPHLRPVSKAGVCNSEITEAAAVVTGLLSRLVVLHL